MNESSVNYCRLLNWFWEEVPDLPGYKDCYGLTFLAIVDLCNRNGWKKTSAQFDRMINRIRINKRSYYEALAWLQEQGLITYTPGRNNYSPAEFGLGPEVQKCTGTTPQPPKNASAKTHHSRTTTDTTAAPI